MVLSGLYPKFMDIMKLLVYVPLLSPRIKYIFNFIFTDILKTQAGFSSNLAEFRASALPKISYAEVPVADEPFFKQADFLLSHTISVPNFRTTTFGDMLVPFAVDNSTLPFDVFAASFYFLSRYEEYLPFEPDAEGNYPAEQSLQSKLKLLEFPVIDGWALMLKNILLKHYPKLHFGRKEFAYIPVLGLWPPEKSLGLKLLAQMRKLVLKLPFSGSGSEQPPAKPGSLQQFLRENHRRYSLQPVCFFKPAEELTSSGDREISLPKSYLQLLKHGLSKDYRMGYSRKAGFRAGTCTPFYWYDLQLEKMTHLLVHPVAVNDLILKQQRTFNPEAVLQEWGRLMEHVKLLSGHFYIVWHRETLPESGKAKAGRRLYAQLLSNFLSLPDDI